MSVYTHPVSRAIPEVVRHLAWFAVVCVVAFLVPFLGVRVLDLQHDLFYLVYFAVTIGVVATYVRVEQVDVAAIFRRRWRWSLGIGVLLAAFLIFNVLNTRTRPRGRTAPTSSSSSSGAASATAWSTRCCSRSSPASSPTSSCTAASTA